MKMKTTSLISDYLGSHYDIGHCNVIEQLRANHYFVCCDSGVEYSVKFYSNLLHLESIVNHIAQLKLKKLNVHQPILGNNNQYVQNIGSQSYVVYMFVRGTTIEKVTNKSAEQLGEICARIHQFSTLTSLENLPKKFDFEIIDKPMANLERFQSGRDSELSQLKKLSETIKSKINTLSGYKSICHGDFHLGNLIFSKNDVTVIDFDFLCISWRVYDAVVFFWNLLFSGHIDAVNRWASFIKGYQSVSTFNKEELDAVPWLLIAHTIWHMGYTGDVNASNWDWSNEWFDKKFGLVRVVQDLFPATFVHNRAFRSVS